MAFDFKLFDVLTETQVHLRCTENSCQFENLFLTKLTG